ncbi:hypothetical protein, partial [Azonexus fungiphilus]|uniref:hypothetical protein n=1 Tax=Azonexus fungiphilus TaxID=146940 RepID=UPI001C2C8194
VVGGQVTVPAGTTTFYVSVATTADEPNKVYEGPETFTLTAGTVRGTDAGVGTITDDGSAVPPPPVNPPTPPQPPVDDRPTVTSVSSPTETEGSNLDFVVTLSNTSEFPTTVTLTLGNTPTAGDRDATLGQDTTTPVEVSFNGIDFVPVTVGADGKFTVDVPASGSSFTVRVPTVDDGELEGAETIQLQAETAQNATPAAGVGTIADNDGLVLTIGDADVAEGQALVFDVAFSTTSANPVELNFTLTPSGANP